MNPKSLLCACFPGFPLVYCHQRAGHEGRATGCRGSLPWVQRRNWSTPATSRNFSCPLAFCCSPRLRAPSGDLFWTTAGVPAGAGPHPKSACSFPGRGQPPRARRRWAKEAVQGGRRSRLPAAFRRARKLLLRPEGCAVMAPAGQATAGNGVFFKQSPLVTPCGP